MCAAVEYCRGYVDEHGQWNNGFYCPQWGGPDRKYCCGTETHRVCCPREQPIERHTATLLDHLPLLLGLAIGCLVVIVVLISVICYFCQGCWVYRRRKRIQHGGSTNGVQPSPGGRTPNYAVSYSVCPHPPYLPDNMGHSVCYPLDDPPPYPGDTLHSAGDEKQPLNPSHLYVTVETPDESLRALPQRGGLPAVVVSDVAGDVVDIRADATSHALSHSASAATAIVRDSSDEDINLDARSEEDFRLADEDDDDDFRSNDFRSGDFRSSPPHRAQRLLLTALGGRPGGEGEGARAPAYTKLEDRPEEELPPSPAQCPINPSTSSKSAAACATSSSSPSSSTFNHSQSIELGAFLRTLSARSQNSDSAGDGGDLGDPQQTTKLLAEGSQDTPTENEPGDDDVTDQEDEDDDVTSELTSCPEDSALEDCAVQIIPQG